MEKSKQPISSVQWVDRESLKPNLYNPNKVAPVEIELLITSILEDGWTQPIVINSKNEIIDGFHRWTVSNDKRLRDIFNGEVPVVVANMQDRSHQQMSTIRHNRARGTHGVLPMADIVKNLLDAGLLKKT